MNLPNKLTIMRIILIPIFMLVLLLPLNWGQVNALGTPIPVTQLLGAIIFAVASITDFADGQIARRHHLVSNFGKFADPLADKMLVMTAFIILVEMGKVPSWVAAIIVCRELAVTGLRLIVVENDGQVMAAAMPGKIKTFTQMFAIIFYISAYSLRFTQGVIIFTMPGLSLPIHLRVASNNYGREINFSRLF